ncbi:MAG: AI-2E family transporter [candidate division Zixibacteria bacterium]|nr:AI-2E family transporter [candidate division Zixibacteria bacterium]MDH3937509.1 AI-2E family transporter [candidate division Zixibacteria bacterium]MDH4034421.1 AI-2E family transporter [candidate division Zixibacteria bacterium]
MTREYLSVAVFFLVAAIFFYLFYRIIIPFFVPICWAAVFAILFFPVYEWILGRVKSPGLTSALLCTMIVLLIIGPITYLFVAVVGEAATAVTKVNELYKSGQLDSLLSFDLPWVNTLREELSGYFDMSKVDLDEIARDAINNVSGILLNQTSWLVANGTKAVFYFALMIFTMYYFFTDGVKLVAKIKKLMPLKAKRVESTVRNLREVIQATMYGGVVVALLQGFLGGVLFAVAGISSPIFWGAIMAFLAIIPFVGASIVYVPAGVILIFGGSYIKGIIVIAVGLLISQTDNVVRPWMISGRTEMHPLMLFFSIMGGIALFGLLGLVMGPIIAAVFVTLIKVVEQRLHADDHTEGGSGGAHLVSE